MEYTKNNNPRFELQGQGTQNKSSSLAMGPRYWEQRGPMDDTTVLALCPMHSRSSDTTLLGQADFERLAQWLRSSSGLWVNEGPQNTMTAEWTRQGAHLKAFWNSTPNHVSGSFLLPLSQVRELLEWMSDKIDNGWVGWRSGRRNQPPLEPGTRVHHRSQVWARSIPGGTGEILSVDRQYPDGEYEYTVLTGKDFASRLSSINPMTRETSWATHHIAVARPEED